MPSPSAPPDYGLDAPGVVRNLLIATGLSLGLVVVQLTGIWSGALTVRGLTLLFHPAAMGLAIGLTCVSLAAWMTWSSKVGKLAERERLLDQVPWTGAERVLDLGCGRGLMLVGAARRVPRGGAVGIDLWQAEDLSGNRPEATLENARREGVGDRVTVETGDMRELPFPDASFDVIVSKAAIHNIYDPMGRAEVLAELARVLKPGGHVVIDDIRHTSAYVRQLRSRGVPDARRVDARWPAVLLGILTWGSLRPGVVVGRRA